VKRCYIIQPGKIGDIIIVLPIAKYYVDRGYDVYWFVCEEYLILFEYVDYVKPIPLFCGSVIQDAILDVQGDDVMYDCATGARAAYYKLEHEISLSQDDLVIDLSIGFSQSKVNKEWESGNLSFDEWKYKKANTPFIEKFNLKINRKFGKEKILIDYIGIRPSSFYSVTHSVGGIETFQFDDVVKKYNTGPRSKHLTFVEVREVKGFTVFDWLGIIEQAQWIYCVNSCVANLVNQLGLCKGRRVWKSLQMDNLNPKMANDWITL